MQIIKQSWPLHKPKGLHAGMTLFFPHFQNVPQSGNDWLVSWVPVWAVCCDAESKVAIADTKMGSAAFSKQLGELLTGNYLFPVNRSLGDGTCVTSAKLTLSSNASCLAFSFLVSTFDLHLFCWRKGKQKGKQLLNCWLSVPKSLEVLNTMCCSPSMGIVKRLSNSEICGGVNSGDVMSMAILFGKEAEPHVSVPFLHWLAPASTAAGRSLQWEMCLYLCSSPAEHIFWSHIWVKACNRLEDVCGESWQCFCYKANWRLGLWEVTASSCSGMSWSSSAAPLPQLQSSMPGVSTLFSPGAISASELLSKGQM